MISSRLDPSLLVALRCADWLGLTKGHKSRAKNNNNEKKKQIGLLGTSCLRLVRLFLHESGTNDFTAAHIHTSRTGFSAAAGKPLAPDLRSWHTSRIPRSLFTECLWNSPQTFKLQTVSDTHPAYIASNRNERKKKNVPHYRDVSPRRHRTQSFSHCCVFMWVCPAFIR